MSAISFRTKFLIGYASLFVWQVLYFRHAITGMGGDGESKSSAPRAFEMPRRFSVDILSVASINRIELLEFQEKTFSRHSAVRNFFNATEGDDYDPTCHEDLTWEDVYKVSTFCHRRDKSALSRELYKMRGMYARPQFLEKKPNPVGWLCAIQRPYAGLFKAYRHYRKTGQELPNFFIIFDDDSYCNMDAFQRYHEDLDASVPVVKGGCVVRWQMGPRQINFTFPIGGFGFILSRGSLEYLFRPIICPDIEIGNVSIPQIANHPNGEAICNQVRTDLVGELRYFEQGMSLLDLIYKYVNTERYRDVDDWTTGFCMHSDWVMGYFVNYYNASVHVKGLEFENYPHAKLESYKESELYAYPTGFCRNEGKCEDGAEICHKPSIEWMEAEAESWILVKTKNETIR